MVEAGTLPVEVNVVAAVELELVVAVEPVSPPNERVGLTAAAVVEEAPALVVDVSNPPRRGLPADVDAGLPRVSPPDDDVDVCCAGAGNENPPVVDGAGLPRVRPSPVDVVAAVVVAAGWLPS